MEPKNQIMAGFVLILHALFIAIGIGVAFFIPSWDSSPAIEISIDLSNLYSQRHSDKELEAWLTFLEMPHEEMLIDKDTVEKMIQHDSSIAQLAFFDGIPPERRVEFLCQRLSTSKPEDDEPFSWLVTFRDATLEDTNLLKGKLYRSYTQRIEDLLAKRDTPIYPNLFCSSVERDNEDEIGGGCPPGVGALLATILVIASCSMWMPFSQRRISLPISITQLITVAVLFSMVGAAVGYGFNLFGTKEWESHAVVRIWKKPIPSLAEQTPENTQLINRLRQLTELKNQVENLRSDFRIDALIAKKDLKKWNAFRNATQNKKDELFPEQNVDGDDGFLRKFIKSRLDVEQDTIAPEIYTLRFRCKDSLDGETVLSGLVSQFTDSIKTSNEYVFEQAHGGVQMAYATTECEFLSTPESERVFWRDPRSPSAFQGAMLGAICSLVLLSSSRVLAGTPPI